MSHFIKDGFQLYNASKDSDYKLSTSDIIDYAAAYEETVMGSTFTGVYSPADIRASVNGARFFKDIFTKNLVRRKNGLLKFKPINFCDYSDQKFDARILKNIYTENPKKTAKLLGIIKNRLKNQSPKKSKKEILDRKPTIEQVTPLEKLIAGVRVLTPRLMSSTVRKAISILSLEPNRQNRLETHIPKEK